MDRLINYNSDRLLQLYYNAYIYMYKTHISPSVYFVFIFVLASQRKVSVSGEAC